MTLTRPNDATTASAAHIDQLVDLYKGGVIFDVKHGYGAVLDGTTDDTAALQAAIDTAPAPATGNKGSWGSPVQLPPGRLNVTSTITLKRGTRLAGFGRASVILNNVPAGAPLFQLTTTATPASLIFRDFTIEGGTGTGDAFLLGTAPSNLVNDVYFQNVIFNKLVLGASNWCVNAPEVLEMHLSDCGIFGCSGNGVNIGSNVASIRDCNFSNGGTGVTALQCGVSGPAGQGNDILVVNTVIEDWRPGASDYAVEVGASALVKFDNCHFESNNGRHVLIAGGGVGAYATGIVFDSNEFDNVGVVVQSQRCLNMCCIGNNYGKYTINGSNDGTGNAACFVFMNEYAAVITDNTPASDTVLKLAMRDNSTGPATASLDVKGDTRLAGVQQTAATLAYSASMTPELNNGSYFRVVVTDGGAMTINDPLVGGAAIATQQYGATLTFEIHNNSGGAMGAITWNSRFHLAGAFTNPANGSVRTISFRLNTNGPHWMEVGRSAADMTP